MPRKPLIHQVRWDMTALGRNAFISIARRACKDGLTVSTNRRYFVGRVSGVIRNPRVRPLLENGRKS